MIYNIIKKRGVLQEGTPFLMDEHNALTLHFNDLSGEWHARLTLNSREVIKKLSGNEVSFLSTELLPGTWNLELIKSENGVATDKIICQPIVVQHLGSRTKGYIVYPEIDAIIARLAAIEKRIADIDSWIDQVKDDIHHHEILL